MRHRTMNCIRIEDIRILIRATTEKNPDESISRENFKSFEALHSRMFLIRFCQQAKTLLKLLEARSQYQNKILLLNCGFIEFLCCKKLAWLY